MIVGSQLLDAGSIAGLDAAIQAAALTQIFARKIAMRLTEHVLEGTTLKQILNSIYKANKDDINVARLVKLEFDTSVDTTRSIVQQQLLKTLEKSKTAKVSDLLSNLNTSTRIWTAAAEGMSAADKNDHSSKQEEVAQMTMSGMSMDDTVVASIKLAMEMNSRRPGRLWTCSV